MNIFRITKSTDFITLLNAVIGIVIIFLSIQKLFFISALLFVAAVIFDTIDGYISRKLRKANEFGKQIDSFADLISFGIAPAVFVYTLLAPDINNMAAQDAFLMISMVIFVIFGLLRLARFNITIIPYFEGMPITVNGVVFVIAYFVKWPGYLYPYLFLALALLMVSTFKVKKFFKK